jgi:hypothetical protein
MQRMTRALATTTLGRPISLQALSLGALLAQLTITPVQALEQQSGEAQALKACDQRVCTLLLQKNPVGDDLKCELTKTWAKSAIKRADGPTLKWGFGDARCSLHLQISRALLVDALTKKNHKLWIPPHTAYCIVEEGGEMRTITATLAPKIVFKEGKAEKIWVNLMGMEGSSVITSLLWAAAKLEDSTGLFQQPMLKAVNKYIYEQCPSNYPQALSAPPRAKRSDRVGKPAGPTSQKDVRKQ